MVNKAAYLVLLVLPSLFPLLPPPLSFSPLQALSCESAVTFAQTLQRWSRRMIKQISWIELRSFDIPLGLVWRVS